MQVRHPYGRTRYEYGGSKPFLVFPIKLIGHEVGRMS